MTRVRTAAHREPVRQKPPPPASPAPTQHAVLDLQRAVGNAATTALIQRTALIQHATPHRGPAAAPVLMRPIVVARDADFGLRSKTEISGYAGPAADFWRANPNLTLQDFGVHLMDEVNKDLLTFLER